MNEITRRFITIIFCSIITLSLKLYNIYTLAIFYGLVTIVCLFEYHYQINTPRKTTTISISLGIFGLLVMSVLNPSYEQYLILIIPLIMMLFSVELFFGIDEPLLNIGTDLIGIVWICFPLYLCILMSYPLINGERVHDPKLIIGCMLIIWFNDAGAYLIGRLIGRTPLFRRISPNKTWEGSFGGALVSMGIYRIVSVYFTFLNARQWFVILIISVVCGCVGDLIESMFKRDLQIKDTSNILPGHGGVLDRCDALLYAIPGIYTYLAIIGYY